MNVIQRYKNKVLEAIAPKAHALILFEYYVAISPAQMIFLLIDVSVYGLTKKHVFIATNLFSPLIILLRELIKSNVTAEHEFDDSAEPKL